MAVQDGLHLSGRDLEPPDLDHFLESVGDSQPAVRVDPADVTGPVPAVLDGRRSRLLGQVAGHQRLRTRLDLPAIAGTGRRAGLQLDHSQVHTGYSASHAVP